MIPDGVLVDLGLPDGSGIELVDDLKNTSSQLIIMTGSPSLESAIAGIRWKAVDYRLNFLDYKTGWKA